MTAPNRSANNLSDCDLQRGTKFHVDELCIFVQRNLSKLVTDQRLVCDRIMHDITSKIDELNFFDTPGRTEKIFLVSLILSTI